VHDELTQKWQQRRRVLTVVVLGTPGLVSNDVCISGST